MRKAQVSIWLCLQGLPGKETREHGMSLHFLTHVSFLLQGGQPYPRTNAWKVMALLNKGYRMPKPNHVAEAL